MTESIKDERMVEYSPILGNLENLAETVQEIKSQFEIKLEKIVENSNRMESLLETLLNKFNSFEPKANKKSDQDEMKTPQAKLNDNKLTNDIKAMRAEIYKLRDENQLLKKGQHSHIFPKVNKKEEVQDFESFKSQNSEMSSDEFEIKNHSKKNNLIFAQNIYFFGKIRLFYVNK